MDIFLWAVPERKLFASKTNALWKLLPSLKAWLPWFRFLAEKSNSVGRYVVWLGFFNYLFDHFSKNKKLGKTFGLRTFFQPGHLHSIFHVSLKTVICIQITLGCSGLCPAGFWLSSRMDILHHLWISCSNDYLHFEKDFSTVNSEFPLLQFVTVASSFFCCSSLQRAWLLSAVLSCL